MSGGKQTPLILYELAPLDAGRIGCAVGKSGKQQRQHIHREGEENLANL